MIKQRILMLVLLCFFAGSWAMAQRGQVKGVKSNMTEETKTALDLTDKQRAELDALQAETAKSLQTARQEGGDRGAAMREIKEADQARLEEILSETQMTTLQSMRMDNKADRVEEDVRTRERVRPEQEERTRVRPEQEEGTRVRQGQVERTREGTRPVKEARTRDISAEDRQNMKAEIDSYRAKNVEPAMLAQRQKLDAAMSAEDRSRLNDVRSQLSTDKDLRNANQNKEVVAMVSKYDTEITRLLTEMNPMQAQWKADQNVIRAKYMGQTNDRVRRDGQERASRLETVAPDMDDKIRFLLRTTNGERR